MNRANEEEMVARFAKNMWWLRAQRRLSQEALAHRAEVHRTQISLFEGEKRVPLLPTILALSGALEVPIGKLVEGISFAPPEIGRSGRYQVEPLIVPDLGEIR